MIALEIATITVASSLFVAVMVQWNALQKTRHRVSVLRDDLRELKALVHDLDQFVVRNPQPPPPPPVPPPPSRRPSTRQVTTAVSDLRKWSSELGESS